MRIDVPLDNMTVVAFVVVVVVVVEVEEDDSVESTDDLSINDGTSTCSTTSDMF